MKGNDNMKDCKKCFYYYKQTKRCVKHKCDISDSKVFGSVCKDHYELKRNKVKCNSCKNMNKYGFCLVKKVCFTPEEKTKERYCKSHFQRKYKK